MSEQKTLSCTVIIEWENVLLSEIDRCKSMLKNLEAQADALRDISEDPELPRSHRKFLARFSLPLNVLIMFDEDEINQTQISTIIENIIPEPAGLSIEYKPAKGLSYYELKNFGAKGVDSDYILFLDSDVIPDEGWLKKLLGSFAEPNVDVAAGNAYIDPTSLYAKGFALSWFFPLKSYRDNLDPTRHFFANNVAFRKKVFERHPFPTDSRRTRGSCRDLAEILTKNDIGVFKNSGAQVSHPPPNGWRHFVIRGLAQGRDAMTSARQSLSGKSHPFKSCIRQFVSRIKKVWVNTIQRHRDVHLPVWGIPVVILQMHIYYTFYLTGALLSYVAPKSMENRFQV